MNFETMHQPFMGYFLYSVLVPVIYLHYNNNTKKTTMETQILNTEKIEATEFTMAATIVTLNSIPSIEKQHELFIDDSIVLEF